MNDLAAQFFDESDTLRDCAAYDLGVIGDAGAVAAFIGLLKSRKTIDKRAASLALGRIGPPVAVAALQNVASDSDAVVRRFAA